MSVQRVAKPDPLANNLTMPVERLAHVHRARAPAALGGGDQGGDQPLRRHSTRCAGRTLACSAHSASVELLGKRRPRRAAARRCSGFHMRRPLPSGRAQSATTACYTSTSFRNGSKGLYEEDIKRLSDAKLTMGVTLARTPTSTVALLGPDALSEIVIPPATASTSESASSITVCSIAVSMKRSFVRTRCVRDGEERGASHLCRPASGRARSIPVTSICIC